MKKTIGLAFAVALVVTLVTTAMAFGPGYGMGKGYGFMGANLTTEQAQKFAQFQTETLPLRQKMLQLRTELMTLMAQTNPDWDAIAAKQKEMLNVRLEIQKKAFEAGIRGFGPGFCRGRGMMGM